MNIFPDLKEHIWIIPAVLIAALIVVDAIRAYRRGWFSERVRRKITLSPRLHFVVRSTGVVLIASSMENVQSIELSLDEAREFFRVIKQSSESRDRGETRLREVVWRVDAREGGQMSISLISPQGVALELVKRDVVELAVDEFSREVGI